MRYRQQILLWERQFVPRNTGFSKLSRETGNRLRIRPIQVEMPGISAVRPNNGAEITSCPDRPVSLYTALQTRTLTVYQEYDGSFTHGRSSQMLRSA